MTDSDRAIERCPVGGGPGLGRREFFTWGLGGLLTIALGGIACSSDVTDSDVHDEIGPPAPVGEDELVKEGAEAVLEELRRSAEATEEALPIVDEKLEELENMLVGAIERHVGLSVDDIEVLNLLAPLAFHTDNKLREEAAAANAQDPTLYVPYGFRNSYRTLLATEAVESKGPEPLFYYLEMLDSLGVEGSQASYIYPFWSVAWREGLVSEDMSLMDITTIYHHLTIALQHRAWIEIIKEEEGSGNYERRRSQHEDFIARVSDPSKRGVQILEHRVAAHINELNILNLATGGTFAEWALDPRTSLHDFNDTDSQVPERILGAAGVLDGLGKDQLLGLAGYARLAEIDENGWFNPAQSLAIGVATHANENGIEIVNAGSVGAPVFYGDKWQQFDREWPGSA